MSSSITRFFDAWGMADAAARAEAVTAAISNDIYYVDPSTPAPLIGVQSLVDHVAMFTGNRPGATAQVADLSEHNGHARATVDFMVDGNLGMRGQYFADLNNEGNITRMVGFIGIGDGA